MFMGHAGCFGKCREHLKDPFFFLLIQLHVYHSLGEWNFDALEVKRVLYVARNRSFLGSR